MNTDIDNAEVFIRVWQATCGDATLTADERDAACVAFAAALDGARLDDALGLTVDARRMLRLAERDMLVRDAITRFFANGSVRKRAEQLDRALRRYETTAWLRDRQHDTPPERIVGSLNEALFRIMKVATNGLSAETIRKILGNETPLLATHDRA